jgi:hypothetical protein
MSYLNVNNQNPKQILWVLLPRKCEMPTYQHFVVLINCLSSLIDVQSYLIGNHK